MLFFTLLIYHGLGMGIENNELLGLTEFDCLFVDVEGAGQDGILTYISVIFGVLPWLCYRTADLTILQFYSIISIIIY